MLSTVKSAGVSVAGRQISLSLPSLPNQGSPWPRNTTSGAIFGCSLPTVIKRAVAHPGFFRGY